MRKHKKPPGIVLVLLVLFLGVSQLGKGCSYSLAASRLNEITGLEMRSGAVLDSVYMHAPAGKKIVARYPNPYGVGALEVETNALETWLELRASVPVFNPDNPREHLALCILTLIDHGADLSLDDTTISCTYTTLSGMATQDASLFVRETREVFFDAFLSAVQFYGTYPKQNPMRPVR